MFHTLIRIALVSAFLAFGAGIELGLYDRDGDSGRLSWCAIYLVVLVVYWLTA